jgi:hypothetical protein
LNTIRGPAKDAAGYYIQPARLAGSRPAACGVPGDRALGFEHGETVERKPYDLHFGQRKAPTAPR